MATKSWFFIYRTLAHGLLEIAVGIGSIMAMAFGRLDLLSWGYLWILLGPALVVMGFVRVPVALDWRREKRGGAPQQPAEK